MYSLFWHGLNNYNFKTIFGNSRIIREFYEQTWLTKENTTLLIQHNAKTNVQNIILPRQYISCYAYGWRAETQILRARQQLIYTLHAVNLNFYPFLMSTYVPTLSGRRDKYKFYTYASMLRTQLTDMFLN